MLDRFGLVEPNRRAHPVRRFQLKILKQAVGRFQSEISNIGTNMKLIKVPTSGRELLLAYPSGANPTGVAPIDRFFVVHSQPMRKGVGAHFYELVDLPSPVRRRSLHLEISMCADRLPWDPPSDTASLVPHERFDGVYGDAYIGLFARNAAMGCQAIQIPIPEAVVGDIMRQVDELWLIKHRPGSRHVPRRYRRRLHGAVWRPSSGYQGGGRGRDAQGGGGAGRNGTADAGPRHRPVHAVRFRRQGGRCAPIHGRVHAHVCRAGEHRAIQRGDRAAGRVRSAAQPIAAEKGAHAGQAERRLGRSRSAGRTGARRRADRGGCGADRGAQRRPPRRRTRSRGCVICEDGPKNVVLIPCGHVCACGTCASRLSECPMCRSLVQQTLRVFMC